MRTPEIDTWLTLEAALPRQITKLEGQIAALKAKRDKTAAELSDLKELQNTVLRVTDQLYKVTSQLNVAEKRMIAEASITVISYSKRGAEIVICHTDEHGKKTSITRHLQKQSGWSPLHRSFMVYSTVPTVFSRAA